METQIIYLIIFTACLWLILDDFFGDKRLTLITGKVVETI